MGIKQFRWLGSIGAVVISLVLVSTAGAAYKPYAVTLAPSSVTAGTVTITATLANESSAQQLGSANLTAPSGFTVSSASLNAGPGTATVAGNVVQLRNLALAPSHSRVVTMHVTTPSGSCSGTTY